MYMSHGFLLLAYLIEYMHGKYVMYMYYSARACMFNIKETYKLYNISSVRRTLTKNSFFNLTSFRLLYIVVLDETLIVVTGLHVVCKKFIIS